MAPASDPNKNGGQNHRHSTADRSNNSRRSKTSTPRSALVVANNPALPPTSPPPSKRRKTDPKSDSPSTAENDAVQTEEDGNLAVDTETGETSTPLPTPKGSKKKSNFLIKLKKDDEVYSVQNIRAIVNGYDMDADSDNEDDGSGTVKQALIVDGWKPEYTMGYQILRDPDNIPRTRCIDDDLYVKEQQGYVIPVKLISYNPKAYYVDSRFAPASIDYMKPAIHYEVTAADVYFVEKLNASRKLANGERYITVELFLKIIKALEIETFISIHDKLLDQVHRVYLPPTRETECDDECDVCGFAEMATDDKSGENGEESEDVMIYCDMCNTVVHTCCAGIEEPPGESDPYWCDKCRLSSNPAPKCVLCPALGGAYTHNVDKTQWAHISCALFSDEIRFVNHDQRAPFSNYEDIPEERFQQVCGVCDTSLGCCVTCSVHGCEETFHVGCGLRSGLKIAIESRAPSEKRTSSKAYRRRNKKQEEQVFRDTHCLRHSGRVESVDPAFAHMPNPWLAKLESQFYLMIDYETVATKLKIHDILVSDVYEYWKLKRIEHKAPLIPNLRDHVTIEPTIARVAEKAGMQLQSMMARATVSDDAPEDVVDDDVASSSSSSATTQKHNHRHSGHFFPAAALMVTEFRQHSLKRVRRAIESDRKMLTMIEKRETLKHEQCLAEQHEWNAVRRFLAADDGDPTDVLEAWDVPDERVEQARDPHVFTAFCDYLNGAEHVSWAEHRKKKLAVEAALKESQNEHKSRDVMRPSKKIARLSLPAASSKTSAGSVGGSSSESGIGRRGPGRTRIYPIGYVKPRQYARPGRPTKEQQQERRRQQQQQQQQRLLSVGDDVDEATSSTTTTPPTEDDAFYTPTGSPAPPSSSGYMSPVSSESAFYASFAADN